MEELRTKDQTAKLARIVVLSSASLDDYLCRDPPPFVHWTLFACASNVYADLIKAEEYLQPAG
jgi:oxidoreductase AflX